MQFAHSNYMHITLHGSRRATHCVCVCASFYLHAIHDVFLIRPLVVCPRSVLFFFSPSFTSSLSHSTCILPSTSFPMSTASREITTAPSHNEEYCTMAVNHPPTVQKTVHVLEDFYDVVSLFLSSSSDEHHCFLSRLGTGLRVGTWETLLSNQASLGRLVSAVVFLFPLVSWWEQYPDTAIPGSDCSDHRKSESFELMCVGWPTSVSRFCFTSYKFLRREIHSWWRSPAWDETMARQWGKSWRGRSSGTTVWTGSTFELLSANSSVHLSTMEAWPSDVAGDWLKSMVSGSSSSFSGWRRASANEEEQSRFLCVVSMSGSCAFDCDASGASLPGPPLCRTHVLPVVRQNWASQGT